MEAERLEGGGPGRGEIVKKKLGINFIISNKKRESQGRTPGSHRGKTPLIAKVIETEHHREISAKKRGSVDAALDSYQTWRFRNHVLTKIRGRERTGLGFLLGRSRSWDLPSKNSPSSGGGRVKGGSLDSSYEEKRTKSLRGQRKKGPFTKGQLSSGKFLSEGGKDACIG